MGDKPAGHVEERNGGASPSPAGGKFFTYTTMRYELLGVYMGRLKGRSTLYSQRHRVGGKISRCLCLCL
jgi:hypothetical protein